MYSNCQESNGGIRPGAIIGGAFLLVLGGTMFLERSGLADIQMRHIIGPACLIILGTLMMFEQGGLVFSRRVRQPDGTTVRHGRRRGGMAGGVWLVGVGCWMIVSQQHLWGLDYRTSWPLLLILSGIMMLLRGLR